MMNRTVPPLEDHHQQHHQQQQQQQLQQQHNNNTSDRLTVTMVQKLTDNKNDANDDEKSPPLLLGISDRVVHQLQAWRKEFCCSGSPPKKAPAALTTTTTTTTITTDASKVGGGVDADDASSNGDRDSTTEAAYENDDKDGTGGYNNSQDEIVNDTLFLEKAHKAISDAVTLCSSSCSSCLSCLVDEKVKTLVKSLCSMYYETFLTWDQQQQQQRRRRRRRRRRLDSEDVLPLLTLNNEKLKQLEWHVHLLLDVWASALAHVQTKPNGHVEGLNDETLDVERVLAEAILEARGEYQLSSSSSSVLPPTKKQKQRKKKQSAKSRTQNNSPAVDHHNDHRQMVLDHLMEALSRAAFLLPATLPFGDFVSLRCLNASHHWDALPQVVSYLYDSFEVANPFRLALENDDDNDNDDNTVNVDRTPTGQTDDDVAVAKEQQTKRQRQGVGKAADHPKKRLKSLLNKPRFKGSRFNDEKIHSLGALSKILDKTPTGTIGRDTSKLRGTAAPRTTNNDLRKGNLGQEAASSGRLSRVKQNKHNAARAWTTSEGQSRSKHGSIFPSFAVQKDRPAGAKRHSSTIAMPPPPGRNMVDANNDDIQIITTPKKDARSKNPTLHRANETPSKSDAVADLLFSPRTREDEATSSSDNLLPPLTLFGISSTSTLPSRKYSSTSIASKKNATTKHGDRSTLVVDAGGSGNAVAARNYIRRKST